MVLKQKLKKIIAILFVTIAIGSAFTGCDSKLELMNMGLHYQGDSTVATANMQEQNAENNTENTSTEQPERIVLEGRSSSYDSLLSIGDTGLCDFYESSTESDQKFNIKVTSVIRGEAAKAKVDEYMTQNDSITITELPSTTEYAVVTYDISVQSNAEGKGTYIPLVKMNIKGTDGNALEYENSIYTTLTSFVTSDTSVKTNEIITLQSIYAIPIGCNDYVMEFGSEDGEKAVFHS